MRQKDRKTVLHNASKSLSLFKLETGYKRHTERGKRAREREEERLRRKVRAKAERRIKFDIKTDLNGIRFDDNSSTPQIYLYPLETRTINLIVVFYTPFLPSISFRSLFFAFFPPYSLHLHSLHSAFSLKQKGEPLSPSRPTRLEVAHIRELITYPLSVLPSPTAPTS